MERITICLTRDHADYESTLRSLKDGLNESGRISPDLTAFIASCIDQFGIDSVVIPEFDGEIQSGKLHIYLRPRMAMIEMDPPAPDFRKAILKSAQSAGLTALDDQNGYLFVPPTSDKKAWWKFW